MTTSPCPELNAEEQLLVGATWKFRTLGEREATRRFAWLAQKLVQINANPVVIQMTEKAVQDERDHALLCEAMSQRFGVEIDPHIPGPPLPLPTPQHLSEREQVLHAVVAFCCVTETLNSGMLVEILRTTLCPHVRKATQQLLTDEVQHSRIGWAHLAAEKSHGVAFLSDYIGDIILDAGVAEIFDQNRAVREGSTLAAYGELSFERRTALFQAAMRDVILPGFASMGIDIHPAQVKLAAYL